MITKFINHAVIKSYFNRTFEKREGIIVTEANKWKQEGRKKDVGSNEMDFSEQL